MPRSRKGKAKATSDPSQTPEMSEEDQWRIINDTGILKRVPQSDPVRPVRGAEDEPETTPFADEIFNSTLYLIPMSFTLLLMEILVHWQYGRKPTYSDLSERMVPGVPILAIFIFYTNRHKAMRQIQFFLFILSTAVGSRLIWLVNLASWRVVMQQCPPLATVWIYAILQLDLGPAVLSLILVGIWMWFKKLSIKFN
ncbi:hypothetical protein B0H21DRAFT_692304 [Amylocystis lapponica]|nr:hypothetical protein B0H21DRAFT_692304 [Amylocystis lapponica]